MTVDDAMLMAYVDGELDAITHRRVERALAGDPALAEQAAALAALTARVRDAFDPVAQAPLPDRLTTLVAGNVVPIAPIRTTRLWRAGLALAASLLLGIGLGTVFGGGTDTPFVVRDGTVVAAGVLGHALDRQLAATPGDIRILATFRGADGYCRVFTAAVADGIACRNGGAWQLRQTRSGHAAPAGEYRQASSPDADLMAAAQDMMVGGPLDAGTEKRLRAGNWQ